ncbi:tetratricopeptide repeat protein [Methyloferula stellata]|uniref:tetratricopeptide repeat protein n=1 Tax=Methyloferula stellata TaxID=876270 RepID=UPI000362FD8F|nr:tetratricopeptide repeat protein [Methyloferula stellata]
MADIFREVDEEVRRDKAVLFFEKYQFWLVGAALLIVAATAGWRIYDYYKTQAAEKASARYEAALQLAHDGKSAEAEAAFEAIAKDAPAGYRALARLRAIDELSTHDQAAAIKAYETLASDPTYDSSLAAAARLRAAMLAIDTEDPKVFAQKVAAMAGPTGAFRYSARELLALAAFKQGDYEAAGRWLDEIVSDPNAPAGLRSRAEAFLGFVRAGKPSQQ